MFKSEKSYPFTKEGYEQMLKDMDKEKKSLENIYNGVKIGSLILSTIGLSMGLDVTVAKAGNFFEGTYLGTWEDGPHGKGIYDTMKNIINGTPEVKVHPETKAISAVDDHVYKEKEIPTIDKILSGKHHSMVGGATKEGKAYSGYLDGKTLKINWISQDQNHHRETGHVDLTDIGQNKCKATWSSKDANSATHHDVYVGSEAMTLGDLLDIIR